MEINQNEVANALKKLNSPTFSMEKSVFPKEVYDLFERNNLTQDEIETLERAELQTRVIELLPDDEKGRERLTMALQAISNEDGDKNLENLKIIAEKDPNMLVQLFALTEVFKSPQEMLEDEAANQGE